MTIKAGYWVDLSTVRFSDEVNTWIQAMPLGTYKHPVHGDIAITPERVSRFASNVKERVRDQDLDVDYDHKARTTEAAGWIRDADARSDGLWILVEWTKVAAEKIKQKAFRYFSPEFVDEWEHPKNKQTFKDVLFGGGLTNRPFLKDILPINMSDLVLEDHSTSPGGSGMDPKKLRELLGLPEDAADEQVEQKITSLSEPKKTDPDPDEHGLSEVLKKLAEENPAVKALAETVKAQQVQLAEMQTAVRLAEVQRGVISLNEEIRTKGREFPAVVLNELSTLLASAPKQLADEFTKLLKSLGEAGFVSTKEEGHSRGGGETDDLKKFNDLVSKLQKDNEGMGFADAVAEAARQDYEGFQVYRSSSYNTDEGR